MNLALGDTCLPSIFYSSIWGFFVLLFFRKRLTIQEALSHPWIMVRLNKETDLGFFHEQSRDHILTLQMQVENCPLCALIMQNSLGLQQEF